MLGKSSRSAAWATTVKSGGGKACYELSERLLEGPCDLHYAQAPGLGK
jgi:hypothetical protein